MAAGRVGCIGTRIAVLAVVVLVAAGVVLVREGDGDDGTKQVTAYFSRAVSVYEVADVRVHPVKGQLLHLRTRDGGAPLAQRIIRTPRCYVVPRPDGRGTVGATSEEKGFDTSVDAGAVHRLLEAAWEVLPDIWELEFVHVIAGLRPATPDNRPLIGRSETDGLVYATGHYRNGILLAPLTAQRVADALAKVAA